jgi:hypothetical protein
MFLYFRFLKALSCVVLQEEFLSVRQIIVVVLQTCMNVFIPQVSYGLVLCSISGRIPDHFKYTRFGIFLIGDISSGSSTVRYFALAVCKGKDTGASCCSRNRARKD